MIEKLKPRDVKIRKNGCLMHMTQRELKELLPETLELIFRKEYPKVFERLLDMGWEMRNDSSKIVQIGVLSPPLSADGDSFLSTCRVFVDIPDQSWWPGFRNHFCFSVGLESDELLIYSYIQFVENLDELVYGMDVENTTERILAKADSFKEGFLQIDKDTELLMSTLGSRLGWTKKGFKGQGCSLYTDDGECEFWLDSKPNAFHDRRSFFLDCWRKNPFPKSARTEKGFSLNELIHGYNKDRMASIADEIRGCLPILKQEALEEPGKPEGNG